jgi:hypothetical protein
MYRIKNLPERGPVNESVLNKTQAPCDNKQKIEKIFLPSSQINDLYYGSTDVYGNGVAVYKFS